ncbi:hypothetical protein ACFW5W_27875 [Streptomyces sp. NPDC058783]|uniref:hypothetical protein n=1 Tax=Streptomyces sp. NPDC058783 TaxID=3346633 RepID=UPI0036882EDF
MQKAEPLQGLLAVVVQGQYGGKSRAQGFPDTGLGGLFADGVRQDAPEPVLVATEQVFLGTEVTEQGALANWRAGPTAWPTRASRSWLPESCLHPQL